jgi:hypothetical protein
VGTCAGPGGRCGCRSVGHRIRRFGQRSGPAGAARGPHGRCGRHGWHRLRTMGMTSRSRFGTWMAILAAIAFMVTSTACNEPRLTKNPALSVIRLNFANFPDGPPPTVFGDGAATVLNNPKEDPGTRFRVAAGKLTAEPTRPERYSSYFCSPKLGAPVVNIGARWTFTRRGGTEHGVAALLISDYLLRSPLPAHLVISPTRWSFGIWPPAAGEETAPLEVLKRGRFDPPLQEDGTTVHEAEIWLEGERAEIRLPDGSTRIVSDKRIADWAGGYAIFEAHALNGLSDTKVGFSEIWAGRNPAA